MMCRGRISPNQNELRCGKSYLTAVPPPVGFWVGSHPTAACHGAVLASRFPPATGNVAVFSHATPVLCRADPCLSAHLHRLFLCIDFFLCMHMYILVACTCVYLCGLAFSLLPPHSGPGCQPGGAAPGRTDKMLGYARTRFCY